MPVTTEAIVLRSLPYNDNTLIVEMLCRSHGRVSFAVRTSATKRGSRQRSLFQPMTQLEVVFNYRERRPMQRLGTCRRASAYISIPFEPQKATVCLFLAEFILHATRESGQQTDALYRFISHSMQWLDTAREGYSNFHLVFITRLMLFLGFYPEADTYRDGDVFDMREGRFVGSLPTHADYLDPADTRHLTNLLRLSYTSMHLFELTRRERNRSLDLILRYCSLHLPAFPELKSLPVLRQVFASDV